jgi:hypothetical protein
VIPITKCSILKEKKKKTLAEAGRGLEIQDGAAAGEK